MKLLTKEILDIFKKTWKQEGDNPLMICKFFDPSSQWTWYASEYYQEERQFYGYVIGFEWEWWYFSLDELEQARGKLGIWMERDMWFEPKYFNELVLS